MKINVDLGDGECLRSFTLDGRLGWTLYQLVEAGDKGVTPLEKPALRWSSYVHQLRQKGIPVVTEMEEHGGSYRGRHARYRLACDAAISLAGSEVRQ